MFLDYRVGYDYENIYKEAEITLQNKDFTSPYSKLEKAHDGVLLTCTESDWFPITCDFTPDRYYLIKLDYNELNKYGQVYIEANGITSEKVTEE